MGGKRKLLPGLLIIALLFLSVLFIASPVAADDGDENIDSDGDGVSDEDEATYGTSPNNNQDYPPLDSDGDGYTNNEEAERDTDPYDEDDHPMGDVDSDGDGFSDDFEDEKGTDPDDKSDRPSMKKEVRQENWLSVLGVTFILSFAIFIIAAGLFTAYFGAGKSRGIGGGLLGLGVATLAVSLYIKYMHPGQSLLGVMSWDISLLTLFLTVLGALLGFVVAVVLFLVAIMKS